MHRYRRPFVALVLALAFGSCGTDIPVEEVVTEAPAVEAPAPSDLRWVDGRQEAAHGDAAVARWYEAAAAVDAWNAELARQAQERAAASAAAEAAAEDRAARESRPAASTGPGPASGAGSVNGYPCGGDLPPCFVLRRESGGNPTAENPTSTASGLWQFLDSTWGGYGGYGHASHAPWQVQNERARQLWDGGRGCSHWSAC